MFAQPAHRMRLVAAFFAALPGWGPPLHAQAPIATHLIAHNTVEIGAPAMVVWPHIMDPLPWKQGLRLRHRSGEPGRVGELFEAFDLATPEVVQMLLQNVEISEGYRRTVKLLAADGTLLGFAGWTLEERDGRTLVRYDVTTETRLAPAEASRLSPREIDELGRASQEANRQRFAAELMALKRLVEGS